MKPHDLLVGLRSYVPWHSYCSNNIGQCFTLCCIEFFAYVLQVVCPCSKITPRRERWLEVSVSVQWRLQFLTHHLGLGGVYRLSWACQEKLKRIQIFDLLHSHVIITYENDLINIYTTFTRCSFFSLIIIKTRN